MTVQARRGQDIRERTFRFGVRVVKLSNRLPRTVAGFGLAHQVIRSGTSIGANLQEADVGESKADFIHKAKIVPFVHSLVSRRHHIEGGESRNEPIQLLSYTN